jgi:hypothetical protein
MLGGSRVRAGKDRGIVVSGPRCRGERSTGVCAAPKQVGGYEGQRDEEGDAQRAGEQQRDPPYPPA